MNRLPPDWIEVTKPLPQSDLAWIECQAHRLRTIGCATALYDRGGRLTLTRGPAPGEYDCRCHNCSATWRAVGPRTNCPNCGAATIRVRILAPTVIKS